MQAEGKTKLHGPLTEQCPEERNYCLLKLFFANILQV